MAQSVADTPPPGGSLALEQADTPLNDTIRGKTSRFLAQPAVRKSVPAFVGMGTLAAAAALYLSIAGTPDRILYSSLSDSERGQVVEALESAGINYAIDNGSGIVSVAEDDLYRARMTVASDGALAAPESGSAILDSMPLGVSRTLEGERLRLARERELMLTIMEIDGIEAVRVHLATPERSVFVRDATAPSASIMVRLAKRRSLAKPQVDAIVNLVSGSVPGLAVDAVKVVDQNGSLLSASTDATTEGFALQRDFESKLQGQLAGLLLPLLGEGNFSTEVQVTLDRAEVTSARESYDKDGVVQSESESTSTRSSRNEAGGIPGAVANTPPPDAALENGPPDESEVGAAPNAGDSESSARRNYALGREVSVTSNRPGAIERISVAVVVSEDAMKKIAPANEEKIKSLVEAAVGIDAQRGDSATVVVGTFDTVTIEEPPFYETGWFAMALRYGGGLVALVLALLLGVRPLLSILRDKSTAADNEGIGEEDPDRDEHIRGADAAGNLTAGSVSEQVALARKLALEQPDRAVVALQRLLATPEENNRVSDFTSFDRSEAAAIFIMLLNDDEAAGLLAHLQPDELEKVGSAMCGMGEIDTGRIAESIAGFVAEAECESIPAKGRGPQLSTLLTKAVGKAKSDNLLQKIAPQSGTKSLEIARWLAPTVLANLVEDEHPQVIAALLLLLQPEMAASVLASLPPNAHPQVLERIARLEKVSSNAVAMLDELLSSRMESRFGASLLTMGGAREAAHLINLAGQSVNNSVLADIESRDSELAKAIEAEMFTFEMLLDLDPKDMGRLLRDVDNQDLVAALKGLDETDSAPFFAAMSSRAAEGVRDEIELLPKLKKDDADAAKKAIVEIARNLRDQGEITIGADDGEFV